MMALEDILSQEIVQKLGWTLLHFVWQAAVAALLLSVLLRVLRKSTANLRYVLACLTLGLIVLLPVITLHLVPISASYPTAPVEPAPVPSVLPMEETKQVPVAEMPVLEEPVQPVENVAITPKVSWKQRTVELLEPALPYIVSGWLVGVFGLSLWHLGGWTQMQRLRRRMVKPVDEPLRSKLKELTGILGVHRAVKLMESALVQAPTVLGWLKPVILLPASVLTGFSADQLEAILAHELAHIRRYDYLVNMLQTVVEILGFYHPAVWWVSHRIRAERENCCDDLAVSISGDRVHYAKALTSMEEIRSARPNLAVAATGGSLFKRISRLLAKDSQPNNRSSWAPAVIAILLIAVIVIPTTLALTGQTSDKSDKDIETTLLDGFRENRSKFKCGVLAWTRKTINDGFGSSVKGKYETEGSFQLWWDGKKIATKYVDERVHSGTGRGWWIEAQTGGNAYDGSLLSGKPKFRLYENWFGQVIRWTGVNPLDKDIATMKKLRHVSLDWSIIEVEGKKQIKLIIKNLKDGASGIRYFDLSRGCNQVRRESYNAQGQLRNRETRKLQQVSGGGWFPVDVDMKSFNTKDGKVKLHHHFVLELSRCSFNEPSAIPEGIFKFSTTKEQEQLNKILEKYSGGKTVDEDNENVKSVCESVENYIAAALAGEDEKAAAYAYPESAVAQQTDDTREALQGQQVQILGVCSGQWNALAISSVILADHGRIGSVVFHLKKVMLEQKTHWLTDDIDLETLDTIEPEIKRFLERNHQAKTVIFKPQRPVINPDRPTSDQPVVQVEDEKLRGSKLMEDVHVIEGLMPTIKLAIEGCLGKWPRLPRLHKKPGPGILKGIVRDTADTSYHRAYLFFVPVESWPGKPVFYYLAAVNESFEITGIPPGGYYLFAIEARNPDGIDAVGLPIDWPRPVTIDADRKVAHVEIEMSTFLSKKVRFWNVQGFLRGVGHLNVENVLTEELGPYGRVIDAKGNPVPYATVQVREFKPNRGIGEGIAAPDARTNEQGYYGLRPLDYSYFVGAMINEPLSDGAGYRWQYMRQNKVFEGKQEINFEFGPWPAEKAGSGTIEGTVVDEKNNPIPSFIVDVRPAEPWPKVNETSKSWYKRWGFRAAFNAGKFALGDVPEGICNVRVMSHESSAARGGVTLGRREITVAVGQTIHLKFPIGDWKKKRGERTAVRRLWRVSKQKYSGADVQVEVEGTSEKNALAWGEEVDGLQLGLSYDSQERPYYQGEIVSFEVHARNNGVKAVDLAYRELFHWCPYVRDVRDTNDATFIVNVHLTGGYASAREEHISLGPGDRQSLGKVALQIGPVPKGAQRAEYSADLEPAGYVVTQRGKFGYYTGHDSWRGELKTGELPLAVLPVEGEKDGWRTLAPSKTLSDPNGKSVSAFEYEFDSERFLLVVPHGKGNGVSINYVLITLWKKFKLRVVAVDKAGNTHYDTADNLDYRNFHRDFLDRGTVVFTGVPLHEIKEFQFQIQPVENPAVQVEGESEVSKLLASLKDEKYAHTRSGIIPLVEENGQELLDKLRSYDSAFLNSQTISMEMEKPVNWARADERQKTKIVLTTDNGSIGWEEEISYLSGPRYREGLNGIDRIQYVWNVTRKQGLIENDFQARRREMVLLLVSPWGDFAEKEAAPVVEFRQSSDRTKFVEYTCVIWSTGRGFADHLKGIIEAKKDENGLIHFTAHGNFGPNSDGLSDGLWEMVVDPKSGYLVRSASFTRNGHESPVFICTTIGTKWFDNCSLAKEARFSSWDKSKITTTQTVQFKLEPDAKLFDKLRKTLRSELPKDTRVEDCR